MRVGWVPRAVAAAVRVMWAWWRWRRRSAPWGTAGGLVEESVDLPGDVAFEAADDLAAGFAGASVLSGEWRCSTPEHPAGCS